VGPRESVGVLRNCFLKVGGKRVEGKGKESIFVAVAAVAIAAIAAVAAVAAAAA
jgi:hypothetical protein